MSTIDADNLQCEKNSNDSSSYKSQIEQELNHLSSFIAKVCKSIEESNYEEFIFHVEEKIEQYGKIHMRLVNVNWADLSGGQKEKIKQNGKIYVRKILEMRLVENKYKMLNILPLLFFLFHPSTEAGTCGCVLVESDKATDLKIRVLRQNTSSKDKKWIYTYFKFNKCGFEKKISVEEIESRKKIAHYLICNLEFNPNLKMGADFKFSFRDICQTTYTGVTIINEIYSYVCDLTNVYALD